ncbi:MAG: hypothetical protein ACNI26_06185 [Terasakiella sp.]|uniref:hypothetical protein n=1 Tax=unclassified Terasakiella TaxID=2614952 RepID=UPI003AFFDCA7
MMKKTTRNDASSLAQTETTKRIVICDRLSLISQNWEKHVFPEPDYFKSVPHAKKRDNRSIAITLAE